MKQVTKKYLQRLAIFLLALIVLLYASLFFLQEHLLFFPETLPADTRFTASNQEEIYYNVAADVQLSALLIKVSKPKGVVFFLPGNAGNIQSWSNTSALFTENSYDVLYLDYRGYGKSTGHVTSEEQLVRDAQIVYDDLKHRYSENTIVIAGTSLGTGIATQLAAHNQPQQLILNAPYYSLQSRIQETVPVIPQFLLQYTFHTNTYIAQVQCPITIFHGTKDTIISPEHSWRLKKENDTIHLIIIDDYGHNDLFNSNTYKNAIDSIL